MQNLYPTPHRPKNWFGILLFLGMFVWSILLLLIFTGCAADGSFVKPIVNAPVVSTLPDGATVTNYVPVVSQEWKGVIDATEATGGLIPPPVGTWVSLGAAGLGAILAAIARNRQKSAEEIAATVIQGIEAAGHDPAVETVKKNVAAVAAIKGNSAAVHNKVKELTR